LISNQIIAKCGLLIPLLDNLVGVHLAHFVKETIPELYHEMAFWFASPKVPMKTKIGDDLIINQLIDKCGFLIPLLENLVEVHPAHFVKETLPELHEMG
jgi:hypothetical protein